MQKAKSKLVFSSLVVLLCSVLFACTGSNELGTDFQLVFGIAGNITPPANCTGALTATGGLLKIGSRKLENLDGANTDCLLVPTPNPPFDLERISRVNTSDKVALLVSIPKSGEVRAYDNKLTSTPLWTYSATSLPVLDANFCPTQMAFSSSQTAIINSPQEQLVVVLDDSKECDPTASSQRILRLIVLNRFTGTRVGVVDLPDVERSSPLRFVVSDAEISVLYTVVNSYFLQQIPLNGINNTTTTPVSQRIALTGIGSIPNTNIALGYSGNGNGTTSLLIGIGGSTGNVFPVLRNNSTQALEIGAELRETSETSNPIGSSSGIFWNRDFGNNNSKNITIFARENTDLFLRQSTSTLSQKATTGFLETKAAIFANDGNFWGISNDKFYTIDFFFYPRLVVAAPRSLGGASFTSINWLISN